MKLIKTQDAVGQVLCHDMTQIIPGVSKGARFRKGHIVTEEDIPVLLSMGKENLYVWEMEPGMVHENDAAFRLLKLSENEHMSHTEPKEGKIELVAECSGLFRVDSERLCAVNSQDEVIIASRHGNTTVQKGDHLAGMRVIPLVIREEKLEKAERAAGDKPLFEIRPFVKKTAAIVVTGSEVAKGLVEDKFVPIVTEKLKPFGISVIFTTKVEDNLDEEVAEIRRARASGADIILCTGGMSVDPDDRTPAAIRASGAEIVCYGTPVLPGAMQLVGYYDDGTPVLGLSGGVLFSKATVFDLLLPRVAADVRITRKDISAMGEGGFCLGCKPCTFPVCPFGKGS